MIKVKSIAIIPFLLILLSCGSKESRDKNENELNKEETSYSYLLNNKRNEDLTINGKVKSLDKYFFKYGTDSIIQKVNEYKVYPGRGIVNYRGSYEFNEMGQLTSRATISLKTNRDTIVKRPAQRYFYKMPQNIKYIEFQTDYSQHINNPNIVYFDYHGVNSMDFSKGKNYWEKYTMKYEFIYEVVDGKIESILKDEYFGEIRKSSDSVIEEKETFTYEKGLVTKKEYSFFINGSPEKSKFYKMNDVAITASHLTHPVELFEYDDMKRITGFKFLINDILLIEEKYTYDTQGNLKTKKRERFNQDHLYSTIKEVFYFDTHENIIQMDRFRKNGELINSQYVIYKDFDQHDNWTSSEVYLNGTKDGDPSMIGIRKITYYD